MTWDKVTVKTLNAAFKKLQPDCCKIKNTVSSVQDVVTELAVENADIVS